MLTLVWGDGKGEVEEITGIREIGLHSVREFEFSKICYEDRTSGYKL